MRVAVVGAGGWGEHHARIFARRQDTELVAVAGRTPERTRARAEKYGATPYTDLALMMERERPDLVTVSLPNEDHYDATLQLVRTGVPLLVEKPLVFDLAEADTLLAEAGDRFFAVNFNHRYAEPVQRAKALIDAGELGEPVFATWRFGGEANRGHSPHANLIETQCHGFDLLEHLVGPITAVSAHMTDKTYGAFSTVALALDFENRAVGTMLGSYDSSYAYPDTQRIEINGTEGRLVIHDTVRALTFSKAGDPVEQVWHSTYFDDEARNFAGTFDRHVDALLTALRAGDPPPVHARAGRRALELAHAAIESHDTGRKVRSNPWTGPTNS
ncbi:Gfo/Idh/MocA family oxidoreductase [Kribbella sp. NPDC048915]|uniref:Gfo/Idh/MocA family protein n=1 Tax=Kribbella sp. NPDC048915 TaxID=3155148 RepID=UPI0033CFF448